MATFMHPETDLYTIESHYVDAIERAGADVAVLPWASSAAEAERRLQPFDALVLSGGQDVDPETYGAAVDGAVEMLPAADVSDAALIHAAIKQGKPILAICRGAQILNVAFGGTLHQHMWERSEHHPARSTSANEAHDAESFLANRHAVALEPGSRIASIFASSSISVNSLHHQSADTLGADLKITGSAPDGTVEVIEHATHAAVGVQWHPERLTDEGHHALFNWIVEQATDRAAAL